MPHHVVGETEAFGHVGAQMLHVGWNQREFVERVGAEPCGEVRLDRDVALHAHLGNLRLDVDDSRVEADVLGPELQNFTRAQVS